MSSIARLLLCVLLYLPKISIPDVKDPFLSPTLSSCQQLEANLITKINGWQYFGGIQDESLQSKYPAILVLRHQQAWLTIFNGVIPLSLLPWQILTISTKSIKWQAPLPNYCHKNIIFTMNWGAR
ncbi:hypothetical protein DES39_0200 [Orbus hercynius]|uniref:Pilus assembly protein HofP n=1 Tax=Orbus hercynius TaxID=593135 RepID=A0A495RHU5_9GAMM|nr:hypothetical protein [Orbus hercynius]RKS86991.1 hypothetical protein DES39_0200 [Orbus hercynius]